MKEIILNNPVMAIFRQVPLNQICDYADAVFKGGIKAFEVAMNSGDALKQIMLLKEHFGDKALVGAGTAISVRLAKEALSAGADFLLTPSADREVLDYCTRNDVKLLPGVMTPTDVSLCVSFGINVLKLFPAGDLPPAYIKSLKGPFDDTEYVAVGGVGPKNIQTFFERGFIGVGIGSSLIPPEYVKNGLWEQAEEYIRCMIEQVIILKKKAGEKI